MNSEGWLGEAPFGWEKAVEAALAEDVGTGDLSAACIPEGLVIPWYVEAQAAGVLSGVAVAAKLLGGQTLIPDGSNVKPGSRVLEGRTNARRALRCERSALNFLMHLSGVATLTRAFVDETEGAIARIVDTRKTLPGLRSLEKYAVRCGGGHNHRFGLYDSVMIKDNHIKASGGIAQAVAKAKAFVGHTVTIEVECESLAMAREAVDAGADIVLLDNMSPASIREILVQLGGRAVIEASGGITLATVRDYAETGVDVISVGSLTHSAPALPFHLEVVP